MSDKDFALWYDESIDDVIVATECPEERGNAYGMINTRDLTLDTEKDETRPSSALIVEALREKTQQVLPNARLTESDKRSLGQLIELINETGFSMFERYSELEERELRQSDKRLRSQMDQLADAVNDIRAAGDDGTHQQSLQDLQKLQSRAAISNIAVYRLRGFQASQQTSWSDLLGLTAQLMSMADCDTSSVVAKLREEEDRIREKNRQLRRALKENEEKYRQWYEGKRWDVLSTVPLGDLVTTAKIPGSSSKQVKACISELGKHMSNASPWHATGQSSIPQDLVTSQDAVLALIDQLESSPWRERALQFVTDKSRPVWRWATMSQGENLWPACRDRLWQISNLVISPFSPSHKDERRDDNDQEENLPERDGTTNDDSHAVDDKSGSLLQSIRQYWPFTLGAPPVGTGVHESDTATAGLTVAARVSNVPTSRDEASVTAEDPSLPQSADQGKSVSRGRKRRSVTKKAPAVLDPEPASDMKHAAKRETTKWESAPTQGDARITTVQPLATLMDATSDSEATEADRRHPPHTRTSPFVASDSYSGDATAKSSPTPPSEAVILRPRYHGQETGETSNQRISDPMPSSVPQNMAMEHVTPIQRQATASSSALQYSATQTFGIPPGDSPVRSEDFSQLPVPLPPSRSECSTVVTDDVHTDHISSSTGVDGIEVFHFTPFVDLNAASCSRSSPRYPSTECAHSLTRSGQLDVTGTENDDETSDPVRPSHEQVEAGSQTQSVDPNTLIFYRLLGSENSLQHTPGAQRRNSAEALIGKGVCHTDYESLTNLILSKGLASKPFGYANQVELDTPFSVKSCLDDWRADGLDDTEARWPVTRRNREDWDVIYN